MTTTQTASGYCSTVTTGGGGAQYFPYGYGGAGAWSSATTTTTTSSSSTALACVTPSGRFQVQVVGQNQYIGAYSNNGAGVATGTSNNLVVANSAAQGLIFSSSADGRGVVITNTGTALYTDQDSGTAGAGVIFLDTPANIATYGYQPVQFCLQPDNTFRVQNPTNPNWNAVRICPPDNTNVYLYDSTSGLSGGCTNMQLKIYVQPGGYP